MKLEQTIQALLVAFKNEDVKKAVLDEHWYQLNKKTGIDTTGFCYSASEVIYRLNGKTDNWKVVYLKDPNHLGNGTHYFLESKHNKEILDVTSSQYEERGIKIPYELGKGTGLRNTSRKARILARMAGLGEL